ncbi:hypothetical protein QF038_004258 [Pseudarthrobacter sp. W1I19]|uniref:DUF4082 domain-containing protein n=1 Tax=Pseudarthrobacter sp. W1I19 TaxID=3042288 RepID=UPI002780FB6E|nr:DUF4082 domain-containing protein [Pseudarthrobacter sp. W1I19]MDQ0925750.1 hypothetical protein [Pseudarthrobacter sp. W1I19]
MFAKSKPAEGRLRAAASFSVLFLIAAMLSFSSTLSQAPAAHADACTPPVASAVACENSLPGTPNSDWEVTGSGDSSIQGFGTAMSVNLGESISFKIKTTASAYRIDILRFGYYQGNGARKIAASIPLTAKLPQAQPACLTQSGTGLVDCGNWGVSASWTVPASAVSGVYFAHLVRNDTGGDSMIPFIVRNDASRSGIVVQTSDTTWQAYNTYGGNSLYQCTVACPTGNPQAYKAAFKVSYNRPFLSTGDQGHSWLMDTEYPMIRFLEANGYDVSYISGLDTATRGPLLLNHKMFMSSGHDEYWSGTQRTNVEAARNAGVNLAFFSGNEAFWRTRWEASIDGSQTAGRTVVSYKDTHYNTPVDPVEWTGTWRDPRFGTASGGGNPENSLTGQFFLVNSGSADIKVPAQYASMRLWRNTAAAKLTGTQSLTLGAGLDTLGYEWDIDADNGFRPAGAFKLSSTTVSVPEAFTDYGSTTAASTQTHNLIMYRAPSGALVFGAGTVQWAYGLDNFTIPNSTPDKNMQQATVNLFADMGVQPTTLLTGLVVASKTTDTTSPVSTITPGLNGQTLADGSSVTASGTASDVGGVVAGVEVSTDGGTTWRPATGTTNWSYTWTAHGSPAVAVKTRATDDSGNIEVPGSGASVNVSCPCSIFGSSMVPATPDSGDGGSVEVGMKFTAQAAGTVTGVSFYKSSLNKGTHVGSLWTSSGTRLATATFTGETATGWQTVNFANPVAITANTVYVVSYFAPQGHYAQAAGFMYPNPSPMPAGHSSLDSGVLHGLRNTPSTGNGVYTYGASSVFPQSSFNAENYWVDVKFVPSASVPPAVSSTDPANAATNVAITKAPSATFNQAVTAGSISFTLKKPDTTAVAGGAAYSSGTVTFTPSAALAYNTTYTATVSGATNAAGQTMASPYSWTFTTGAPPPAPAVSSTSPANQAAGVPISATPSATFNQAVTAGSISFTLKKPDTTAVAGGAAYSSGTVTFTPSAALAYNTTYTATVSGATNAAGQTMASPYSWTFTTGAPPPAPAVSSTSPANQAAGVPISATPSATFNQAVVPTSVVFNVLDPSLNSVPGTTSYSSATNTSTFVPSSPLAYNTTYRATVSGAASSSGQAMASPYSWTFTTATAPVPPAVASTLPADKAAAIGVNTSPSATFNQVVTASSITFTLQAGTTRITGSSSYSGNTVTFTPGSALAYNTTYSATVSGATNAAGQAMTAPYTWTFTTAAQPTPTCPCSVFASSALPGTIDQPDGSSVELGMKFRSDIAGNVTGVRFYKSSQNTGTHTGKLWTSGGQLLASVTFTGESGSGWQQANFSTPVAIQANTTYIVSYYAPNGHYSADGAFFTNGVDNYPLHGLASGVDGLNGVYRYGTSAFPSSSYNNANYWVDVVLNGSSSVSVPTVSSTSPAPGATNIAATTTVKATYDRAVDPSTVAFNVKDAGNTNVSGTLSYDTLTNTSVFTPTAALAYSTTFTATVSGAKGSNGQALASPYTWSFTTVPQPTAGCPCSVFAPTAVPSTVTAQDNSSVELGMKFSSDTNATVTAVRFYKGPQNTGTHVGKLWTSGGQLLGSVTFTNEGASGWQRATFATPIPISANTVYVVSYLAPNGYYSADGGFFAGKSADSGILHGLADGTSGPNGVYAYGAGGFPGNTWNATNYWMDVEVTTP